MVTLVRVGLAGLLSGRCGKSDNADTYKVCLFDDGTQTAGRRFAGAMPCARSAIFLVAKPNKHGLTASAPQPTAGSLTRRGMEGLSALREDTASKSNCYNVSGDTRGAAVCASCRPKPGEASYLEVAGKGAPDAYERIPGIIRICDPNPGNPLALSGPLRLALLYKARPESQITLKCCNTAFAQTSKK